MRLMATSIAVTIFVSTLIFCSCSTQDKQLSSGNSPSATPSLTPPIASSSSPTPNTSVTQGESGKYAGSWSGKPKDEDIWVSQVSFIKNEFPCEGKVDVFLQGAFATRNGFPPDSVMALKVIWEEREGQLIEACA